MSYRNNVEQIFEVLRAAGYENAVQACEDYRRTGVPFPMREINDVFELSTPPQIASNEDFLKIEQESIFSGTRDFELHSKEIASPRYRHFDWKLRMEPYWFTGNFNRATRYSGGDYKKIIKAKPLQSFKTMSESKTQDVFVWAKRHKAHFPIMHKARFEEKEDVVSTLFTQMHNVKGYGGESAMLGLLHGYDAYEMEITSQNEPIYIIGRRKNLVIKESGVEYGI